MFLGFTIGTELFIICNKLPNHSRWQAARGSWSPSLRTSGAKKEETPLMLMKVPLDPQRAPWKKWRFWNPNIYIYIIYISHDGSMTLVCILTYMNIWFLWVFHVIIPTWNPKQPFINGCFNWMIPNLYIENGCFTKHPFINGCLGFQVKMKFPCLLTKRLEKKNDTPRRFVVEIVPFCRSFVASKLSKALTKSGNVGLHKVLLGDHSTWSNYSDLTRPHPKWWLSKGNPLISGKSGLVKYYNLARSFDWNQFFSEVLGWVSMEVIVTS